MGPASSLALPLCEWLPACLFPGLSARSLSGRAHAAHLESPSIIPSAHSKQ